MLDKQANSANKEAKFLIYINQASMK